MITEEQIKFGGIILLVGGVGYTILSSLNTGPTIPPLPFKQSPYGNKPFSHTVTQTRTVDNNGKQVWSKDEYTTPIGGKKIKNKKTKRKYK